MSSMMDFFGEPISAYTREQALEDGVLIDVTDTARENGFRIPVAITAAVWDACAAEGDETAAPRVRDVCWMAFLRVRAALSNHEPEDTPKPYWVTLWRQSYHLWIMFSPYEGFTIGLPSDF